MRIVFLLDPAEVPADNPHFDGKWQPASPSMEHHVIHAARRCGHSTFVIPFGDQPHAMARRIEQYSPDLAFNLVEDYGGNRRLGSHVPSLLDALAVPYTGCSSIGLTYSCDKVLASRLVAARGVAVPGFAVVAGGGAGRLPPLRYPLIVKPRLADGSEGISLRSIVRNPAELVARARLVQRRLRQGVVCQEYIDGREISVAVLGNRTLQVLPPRETVFGMRHKGGPGFCTERVKESKTYSEKWQVSYRRADLSAAQQAAAVSLTKTIYSCLELSGYGRVDFRMDAAGRLFFLEANGNPDLRPRVFGIMAAWAGIQYTDLIQRIIDLALRRRREPSRYTTMPGPCASSSS